MITNYYIILGIDENADIEQIKSAYKKLSMLFHPDRGGNPESFKQIHQAYQVLSDPVKRKQYDHWLNNQSNPESDNKTNITETDDTDTGSIVIAGVFVLGLIIGILNDNYKKFDDYEQGKLILDTSQQSDLEKNKTKVEELPTSDNSKRISVEEFMNSIPDNSNIDSKLTWDFLQAQDINTKILTNKNYPENLPDHIIQQLPKYPISISEFLKLPGINHELKLANQLFNSRSELRLYQIQLLDLANNPKLKPLVNIQINNNKSLCTNKLYPINMVIKNNGTWTITNIEFDLLAFYKNHSTNIIDQTRYYTDYFDKTHSIRNQKLFKSDWILNPGDTLTLCTNIQAIQDDKVIVDSLIDFEKDMTFDYQNLKISFDYNIKYTKPTKYWDNVQELTELNSDKLN